MRLPNPPPPPGLYRASRATLGLSGWKQRLCQGPDLVGAIGIRQAVSRWAPLGGTRGSARDQCSTWRAPFLQAWAKTWERLQTFAETWLDSASDPGNGTLGTGTLGTMPIVRRRQYP